MSGFEFKWPSSRLSEPKSYDYSSINDLVDNIRILVYNERKDVILFGMDKKIYHLAIEYSANIDPENLGEGINIYCQGSFPNENNPELENSIKLNTTKKISIKDFSNTIKILYSDKNAILPPMAVATPLRNVLNDLAEEIIQSVEGTNKFIDLNSRIKNSLGIIYSGNIEHEVRTKNSFNGYFYTKEDTIKFLLNLGSPCLGVEFNNDDYFPQGEFDHSLDEYTIILLSFDKKYVVFNVKRSTNFSAVFFGNNEQFFNFEISDFFITEEIGGLDKNLLLSKHEDWKNPKKLALVSFDMRNLAMLRDIDNMVL